MSTKTFLLQECKNVGGLLDQTLKYEYGVDGSRDFYEECATRLRYITSELQSASETDLAELASSGVQLNELARLICRIERSSLGQYSWPFVEQLKKIAAAICTEASLLSAGTPPKVYILADGGLDTYAIYYEPNRPRVSQRRILTIVFPKSLKHFVLLHPILGHEVGHAIWRCSKHQGRLRSQVISRLTDATGIFASPDATANHLFSTSAPNEVKDFLKQFSRYQIDQTNLFSKYAKWDAWIEEILCDLIGLATFGPSFVAAHCELLYALNPSGIGFGPMHPPVAWRVNLMLRGATLLGYDAIPEDEAHEMRAPLKSFWGEMRAKKKLDPWFEIFSDTQLGDALAAIQKLLTANPPSPYSVPTIESLQSLLGMLRQQVPPVGFSIDEAGNPVCTAVDFRHIIFAGWIASKENSLLEFDLVNRLCEHAIMQQGAIDVLLGEEL